MEIWVPLTRFAHVSMHGLEAGVVVVVVAENKVRWPIQSCSHPHENLLEFWRLMDIATDGHDVGPPAHSFEEALRRAFGNEIKVDIRQERQLHQEQGNNDGRHSGNATLG